MSHDIIATIIFVIFSIVMTFQSIRLGVGISHQPGPGFLPIFSTICMGILSIMILISQVLKYGTKKELGLKLGPYWQRGFYIMAISFFYVSILWNRLGYIISTTLWLVFVFKIGGIRSWKKSLIIAIAAVIISYLLFGKLGKCFLPRGIFGF